MGLEDDVRFVRLGKKKQEREILDGFLHRLSYRSQVQASEQPDFIVRISDRVVGAEITKYFSDFSDRGSLLERTVSKWTKGLDEPVFTRPAAEWPTPPFQSGEVEWSEVLIAEIICTKEAKATKYRRDFDQRWLIIYAAGFGYHDMVSPSLRSIVVNVEYFSHVFLWDKFSEEIHLVFPYQKTVFSSGKNAIYARHLPIPPQPNEVGVN